MSHPVVRAGERGDLATLVSMWRSLVETAGQADSRYRLNAHSDVWFHDVMRDQLFERRLPFPGVLVVEVSGDVVAFLTMRPKASHPALATEATVVIGDLYVAPEHRNQGLGSRLVANARETARASGYHQAELHTLFRDERAMGFWQRQGFRPLFVTLRQDLSAAQCTGDEEK